MLGRHKRGSVLCGIGSAAALWLLSGGQVWAQSLPDGPLSAPNAIVTPPAKAAPAKAASPKTALAKTRKPKKAAAAAVADPLADTVPERRPTKAATAKPVKDTSADPLSLGMKWNGSNDNAEQTRIQNYGGGAAGTGASVGLKYHF